MQEHEDLRKVEGALSELRSATEETWKNNLRGFLLSILGAGPALVIIYFAFHPNGVTAVEAAVLFTILSWVGTWLITLFYVRVRDMWLVSAAQREIRRDEEREARATRGEPHGH